MASCARGLAQEVVSWYLDHVEPRALHEDNVQKQLRPPIQAVTLSILQGPEEVPVVETTTAKSPSDQATKQNGNGKSAPASTTKQPANGGNTNGSKTWRDYIQQNVAASSPTEQLTDKAKEADTTQTLGRRSLARMDAFLDGVVLAVPQEEEVSGRPSLVDSKPPGAKRTSEAGGVSLVEGLAGFRAAGDKGKSPVFSSLRNSSGMLRTLSISSSQSATHRSYRRECPQIGKEELVTRTELYIRSLYRVKSQHRECVIDAEPVRAVKARAQSVVMAFIDTVGTVRQQSPVLTRLLHCLTRELLAAGVLGENIMRVIRRIVSEYEHKTSFASLAFLSSPEKTAHQALTPMVLKYIRYLQQNWELCESECELERFLSLAINPHVRNLFKTIEFRSIGHLLEVCQEVRSDLQHIEIEPDDSMGDTNNEQVIQQALRDLRREVITVNGHVLPPVSSRQDLCHLLSQTLNSRTLTNVPPKKSRRRRKGASRRTGDSARSTPKTGKPSSATESDGFTSPGVDPDTSDYDASGAEQASPVPGQRRAERRRSSFKLSAVDFLTRRLLLAAGRTGTGGDAYFVVRDLFGGDEVEVVPNSDSHGMHGRHPGTIEILLKLASVTINCHGSFDVFPKSLVGDCEPLIQVHTTTTETIALREVRRVDSSENSGALNEDVYSSTDDAGVGEPRELVIEEVKTAKSGWKTLSIRPALYEKIDVWNTPS